MSKNLWLAPAQKHWREPKEEEIKKLLYCKAFWVTRKHKNTRFEYDKFNKFVHIYTNLLLQI